MAYLDSSAFVKLPLEEQEHRVLRQALAGWDALASSTLLGLEAVRACMRYGSDEVDRAKAGLSGVTLLPIDDAVLRAAASLEPASLRSLDAIHLATALSLGPGLGAMFVYDERLGDAARAHGLRVESPA